MVKHELSMNKSALYKTFGEKYRFTNINQSYLYYQNALYHYRKEKKNEDIEDAFILECQRELKELKKQSGFEVVKTSIVILSYNNQEITKNCIESIRQYNLNDTYEIIVVDNASEDGIQDWLTRQEDISFIKNEKNMGFPYGCNQGIDAADASYNILLLNNDTIVTEDALFWLRIGLYENEKVGAVGSVSNRAANQTVAEFYESIEQWMEFAKRNNLPMKQPYEKRSWLVGFAMLVKRSALETVLCTEQKQQGIIRESLDLRFSPGTYEDNDLSIRLILAGYYLLLVKNSFIYHYGGKAFSQMEDKCTELMIRNRQKLAEKYGVDLVPYFHLDTSWINVLKPAKEKFTVLEVGSKLGVILARIESIFPEATVLGLEKNVLLARLSSGLTNVRNQDFLDDFDETQGLYDIIIFNGSLDRVCAKKMIQKAECCLNDDGKILLVFWNEQCIRKCFCQYESQFRLDEIIELCMSCKLQISELNYRCADLTETEINEILHLYGCRENNNDILYRIEEFVLGIVKCQ